ncbi:MAG: tetratricopeptide repeat protein [Hyphomicrobiaceae bacterium]
MVDRTDSFLREVGEDVRRDQLLQILQRYGVFIAAGIIALFVGVGGYKWWAANQNAAREAAGAKFIAASRLANAGKTEEALKAFSALQSSAPEGYKILTSLRIAGEHARAGRTAEALAAYEAVAKDTAGDEILRDFAALQSAMLRLDQGDWTEIKNRLTPLVDDSRPWHAEAREVMGLAAYKAGRIEDATKLFEQILGDRATPQGLSRRAQEMLALLTDAAAAKSSEGKAAAPDAAAKTTPEAGTSQTAPAKDEGGDKDKAAKK